ncbi:MAG TPA: hypothetical protein VJB16_06920 [archaeon]|nr:hypothetical protein [archaeon]
MHEFSKQCPRCGTSGKLWHTKPEVFICNSCSALFSRFGFVTEPEEHQQIDDVVWS